MFKQENFTYTRLTVLLVAAVVILNLFYNAYLPIHPDEAYYWYWSQRLELGYFDHPPLIAYLIKLSTLFSDHVFFIRLVAIFSVTISAFFIYRLTERIGDAHAAMIATALYLSLPVTQISATITTPDSALLIFWSGALYFGYLALFEQKIKNIYLTGLFLGLALLSKLPAILLVGILGLMILLKRRQLLASVHTWIAFGMIFVIFSGMLYWNARHEWISFTFQYAHGSTKDFAISLNAVGEYLGGLVLLITPLLFITALYIFAKTSPKNLNGGEKYLLFITGFILLFFGYKGLFKPMALNWYAPALLTLIPFLAFHFRRLQLYKTLAASLAVALCFSFIAKFPATVMPKKSNPEYSLMGYEKAVDAFKHYIAGKDEPLCSDYYSTTAVLYYFMPEYQGTISSVLTSRPNMFTIWDKEDAIKIPACLAFVERDKIVSNLKNNCRKISNIHKEVIPGKNTSDKTFFFFRCELKTP